MATPLGSSENNVNTISNAGSPFGQSVLLLNNILVIIPDPSCVLCGMGAESIDHLCIHCPIFSSIWGHFFKKLEVCWAMPKSVNELFMSWRLEGLSKKGRLVWITIPQAALWSIWMERNNRIFCNQSKSPDEIVQKVVGKICSWVLVNEEFKSGYASNGASALGGQSDGDSTNTTIFVGGLDPSVTDEDLRQPFSQYGEIVSVKIPVGKGCGFVQFANRTNAEEALQKLNGTVIGKQTVRLSWGRNPANKLRADPVNQWNGAYYGGQVYDGYGYAVPPPQDPSMYAAATAYGAYPIYGNHQQQVS